MGWYDLFHSSDGPTLYTISNRTSVTYDVSIVAVCILFSTLFFAFVIIFPGIRKQVSVTSSYYQCIVSLSKDIVTKFDLMQLFFRPYFCVAIFYIFNGHVVVICRSSHTG